MTETSDRPGCDRNDLGSVTGMTASHAESATQIDLFWRPGCGFCSSLRNHLDQLGIERVEHNIWDEPDKADVVRSIANGNETVPTIVVGGFAMVNPSAGELVAHLAQHAPHLLPDDSVA